MSDEQDIELGEADRALAENFNGVVKQLATMEPERVLMHVAYFLTELLGQQAGSVMAAVEMDAHRAVNSRVHALGSALTGSLDSCREFYDVMFDPEALQAHADRCNAAIDMAKHVMSMTPEEAMEYLMTQAGLQLQADLTDMFEGEGK